MPNVRKEYEGLFQNTPERRKQAAALATRERRAWAKKIMEAQEAVEAAEDARAKAMADAYAAGVSLASIENSTGLGPQTVRNIISDTWRAGEDQ